MSVSRGLLLSRDLLFGSKVESMIELAGLVAVRVAASDKLAEVVVSDSAPAVVVVDLADPEVDGISAAIGLRADGYQGPLLGYYAHTDLEIKDRAEAAGFDQLVPRSRLAREGSELIAKLCVGRSG